MWKRMIFSWKGFLGAVVLLGGLAALALAVQGRGLGATTAGLGNSAGAAPAALAQAPARVQVDRAQAAVEEAATPLSQAAAVTTPSAELVATELPRSIAKTPLSPEQAMDVVQKSGLDSSQVSSIDLTIDASGRQIYEVRNGGPNSAVLRVDVLTGALLAPGK